MRRTSFRLAVAPLALGVVLGVLLGGCAGRPGGLGWQPAIDIAALTVLEEEYFAAAARVEDPATLKDTEAVRYRRIRGEIASDPYERSYEVVVGMAGGKGEVAGALATRALIARWNPRYVLLVGIAGGVGGTAAVGDVVLPDPIWGYELGHLTERFSPKLGSHYAPDAAVLQAARAVRPEWIDGIRAAPPGKPPASRVLDGPIASGNKVIESKGSVLYSDLVRAKPGFIAVEMEGAGAAAAVVDARDEGYEVGFMMVRAISDVIRAQPEADEVEGEPTSTPSANAGEDTQPTSLPRSRKR